MNISRRIPSFIVFVFLAFATWPTQAQLLQEDVPQLQPVETPPAFGTFWFVLNKAPYPFDPYHGALPIFEVGGGIYLIDDTSLFDSLLLDGGGLMSLMSGPTPPGLAGTNSVTNLVCNSLTNFTVNYLYANNTQSVLGIAQTTNPWIALTIQTKTNSSYDMFGTTNMVELALPSLSRTNWTWLMRANGRATNFSWGLTNWCERYFQLGSASVDPDGDGLSTAYEQLVSHTNPTNADSPRVLYETAISNQSPSGWFKLNDRSFTNSAASGGLGLTNDGGLWDPDAFAIGNGAYSFSQQSDKLVVTNDAIGGGTGDATNQGSFTLLFKALTRKATSKRYVLSQGVDTSTSSGNAIGVYFTNNGALKVGVGPVEQIILEDSNIVRGAWYYLAVSCNETNTGNAVRWYLGQVGSQTLQTGGFPLGGAAKKFGTTNAITLGNKEASTNSAFRESATTNGSIDQVAFWKRELTEAEVKAQFDSLTPLFQGPAKVFDLTRWNLLLPVNKTNQLNPNHLALEINTGWLNSGFKYVDPTNWTQKYFYLSTSNTMVFEVPWNGARSIAGGARSELRETLTDGSKHNWLPLGTNTLEATCAVHSAGTNNDRKVIIGQIHSETAADPPVTISYNFPSLKNVTATYKTSPTGGTDLNLLLATNVNLLVDRIHYQVRLTGDGTNLSLHVEASVNGVPQTATNQQNRPLATSPSDAWHTNTFYFKAGCYYPTNGSGSPIAGTAKVTFSSLTATH